MLELQRGATRIYQDIAIIGRDFQPTFHAASEQALSERRKRKVRVDGVTIWVREGRLWACTDVQRVGGQEDPLNVHLQRFV